MANRTTPNMSEYQFSGMLKNYINEHGWKGIFLTNEFILPVIISLIFMTFAYYEPNKIKELFVRIYPLLIALCITLLTILIAVLAIIVSFTDENYILFLKEQNVYSVMTFSFRWTVYVITFGIIFNLFLPLFYTLNFRLMVILPIGLLGLFFSLYSLFCSVNLMTTIVWNGILRTHYIEKKRKEKEEVEE